MYSERRCKSPWQKKEKWMTGRVSSKEIHSVKGKIRLEGFAILSILPKIIK
jgi:predicted DNA binding CopG/RHH family protein